MPRVGPGMSQLKQIPETHSIRVILGDREGESIEQLLLGIRRVVMCWVASKSTLS